MISITAVWTVVFGFLLIFRCGRTFRANWGSIADSLKYCSDENPRQVGFAATDAFTDLVILVLPIPLVSTPFDPLGLLFNGSGC